MLRNAYFLAKIGADTAEIELDFAEICRSAGCAACGVKPAELDHFHELIIHEEFGHMLIPSWSDGLCAGSAGS